MARKKPTTPSEPRASERMKWPHLSQGVDTSFPTLENLDAQQQWLTHIAAGQIILR